MAAAPHTVCTPFDTQQLMHRYAYTLCLCTKRIFNLQPLPFKFSLPVSLKPVHISRQRATCSSRASTATSLSFPASMLARSPSTPPTAFSSRLARRASTDPTTFLSWSPGKFFFVPLELLALDGKHYYRATRILSRMPILAENDEFRVKKTSHLRTAQSVTASHECTVLC